MSKKLKADTAVIGIERVATSPDLWERMMYIGLVANPMKECPHLRKS